jgi:hypothetical protein
MNTHPVSSLVFDFSFYPRSNVDTQHVGYIAQAVEGGATLPPVVIDKKSKRIVDGFHRTRAYRNLYGDDHEIECVEKAYKSDKAMFLDAMRYNAAHGRRLTTHDRAHCINLAQEFKMELDGVATALQMTLDKTKQMKVGRFGEMRVGKTKRAVPLKRTIANVVSGKTLTPRQVEANDRLSGMTQVFYVNQVIELIEADLLDVKNENLIERLAYLRDLIGRAV